MSLRAIILNLAAFALIAVVMFATYQQALDNDFLFDDRVNITQHEPLHVSEFSLQKFWSAGTHALLKSRIVPSITFAVDWWRGDGEAKAFIQTNMLLHAINGFLVFILISLVMKTRVDQTIACSVALLSALIWLTHPIQAQAVTYIVQRMSSMAALFTLLAVIAYIKSRQASLLQARIAWATLLLFSALAGALSKENAWILPALLLLTEYGVVRADRTDWVTPRERIALIGLLIAALLVFASLCLEIGPLWDSFQAGYARRDFTLWERVLTQPRVIAFHLSQIVFPLPDRFSLIHGFSISHSLFNPFNTLLAWLAAMAWIATGFVCLIRQRTRPMGFFILWLPLTLLIESSVVPLEIIFEHRFYLPTLGIAGLVAFTLTAFWQAPGWGRSTAIAGACGVIVLLVSSTVIYIPIWKSELQVYQRAVHLYPDYMRAHALYGHALLDQRNFKGALAEFLAVQKMEPDWPSVNKYTGRALAELGRFSAAEREFKRGLEIQPNDVDLLNNMAGLSLQRRDLASAEQWLNRARSINSQHPLVRANWRNLQLLKYARLNGQQ